MTALLSAAHEGHADVVKALLVAKADVNAKKEEGVNALMMTTMKGHRRWPNAYPRQVLT